MAISSCARCKNLFNKTIKDICSNCVINEEADYKKVRMYLKRYRIADMTKASIDTGVDVDLIYKFLQEGRINLNKDQVMNYPCKTCGETIQSGALCANCEKDLNDVQNTLQDALKTPVSSNQEAKVKNKGAFHAR